MVRGKRLSHDAGQKQWVAAPSQPRDHEIINNQYAYSYSVPIQSLFFLFQYSIQ